MTDLVLRNALALLGEKATLRTERADITIAGTRIASVSPPSTLPPRPVDIDASRLFVTPGLVNGHYHSWDHYQKGCLENLPLEPMMAYMRPPKPIPLTPRDVYLRTMLGAIEALRTGTTLLVDDLSLGAVYSRDNVEAALQAYEDSGIRALVGFSMIDRSIVDSFPFVDECFPPDQLAALRALPRPQGEQLLALCRELAVARHPSRSRVGLIIAPSAPQRCTDGFLRACREIADTHGLATMIHVQETRLQAVTAQAWHGRTFIEHLADVGFLGPHTTVVHGTWLAEREIGILAASGATVQHNPWSNLMLGSGVAPLRAMLDAGVNVALGSDGMASTLTCSMLNVLGTAAALGKVRDPEPSTWLSAREVWDMGTRGGARALGMEERLGRIEAGMTADLVGYRLDRVAFTPLNDALVQLVYAERGANIDLVVVDGSPVMRDGRLTQIDETALLAEAAETHTRLQPDIDAAHAAAHPLRDTLLAMYRRSLAQPLAQPTYPGWLGNAPSDA
jgi:5-methylthioadenosine/S-adenosylhomocysteine deaminase